MADTLPILPTTVVGSHGLSSWLWAADDWINRGLYGPIDLEETYNDAVDRAILDQQIAGIDIITDGEMRRRGFVQTFAGRITGLRNVGPPRKVGEIGIDQDPVFETTGKVEVLQARRVLQGPHPARGGVRPRDPRRDPASGAGGRHPHPARRAGDARVRRRPVRQEGVRALLSGDPRGQGRSVRLRVRDARDVRDRALARVGSGPRAVRRTAGCGAWLATSRSASSRPWPPVPGSCAKN